MALEYAMFGIYAGQGEVCSAGSRLVLQRKLADRFLPRLAEASNKIVVGDGLDPRPKWDRSSRRSHMERVLGYIEAGKAEGAKLICGGRRLTDGKLADGQFRRARLSS